MLTKEYDLKLLELFKEQKIYTTKRKYDGSLRELWNLEVKTTRKVAIAANFFTSTLIFFGFNNLDFFIMLAITGLSAMLIWPIAMNFGESVEGRILFRLFITKDLDRIKDLSQNVENYKQELSEEIVNPNSKEFFSRLYLFLNEKIKTENNLLGQKKESTVYLSKKINKIIEAYMDDLNEKYVDDIIYELKDSEEEIKEELNKSITPAVYAINTIKVLGEKEYLSESNEEKLFKK